MCGQADIFPFLEVKKKQKYWKIVWSSEGKGNKIFSKSEEKLFTKLWVQYTMFNTKMHLDMKLYSRSFFEDLLS